AFDVVRRWLRYRGYEVTYIVNVTDIEDKIIAASREEDLPWSEVAGRYTESYLDELHALGVRPPTAMPKASEHIEDIIALVTRLTESGHAYALEGGDVAFHVASFPEYGRLSRRDLDQQVAGARVEEDQRKRDARDFFLWKAAKPGEPSWDSPWGPGRPGWHIECSAMSEKYLGPGFDIHGGGSDLLFPHHENEIAQSESVSTMPLAKYWMHNGMLNIRTGSSEGEKMSKSLGNVVSLRDTISRVGGAALRYFYIAAHYRSDIPFDDEALEQARSALERLRIARQTVDRLLSRPAKAQGDDVEELAAATEGAEAEFHEAMDDDFSTPRALAALHGLVGAVNRAGAGASATFTPSEVGQQRLRGAREALVRLANVLGLNLEERRSAHGLEEELLGLLIDVREKARAAGNYEIADAVRTRLADLGIALEDRPDGTSWRVKL
ncbi:MAG: cysteine--tRNA ligase, partial [Armatimonadetes bacterium]|nr:cysteine--tRNA ligase [Armatimonadota bacterium]